MSHKSLKRQREGEMYLGFCYRPGSRYEPLPRPEPIDRKKATRQPQS